jgi:hypothetical protein
LPSRFPPPPTIQRKLAACGLALCLLVATAGCGGSSRPDIATAAGSPAAPPERPAVLDLPLTAETVADLLAADGHHAVRMDAGSVVLRGGDLQLLVFLEDEGTSLQGVLPYIGLGVGDPQRIEQWNATRRFGRAYLDHEEGPILACDLLLEPGVPASIVQTWARLLLAMAAVFSDEVWPPGGPPATPHAE